MHTALVIGKRNLQLKAVHRLPKSGRVYFCTSPKQSSGISLLILAMLALDKGPCVAILETDVPMPELQAQYGGYGDMFTRLLTEGAKAAALPIPNFTAWDILNHPESYPDPADFDAILITGHSAYEDYQWIHKLCNFVRWIYEDVPSKKIIGICFGHQIVAQALGGKVELNPKGWEIAVRRVQLAESAKRIFDMENAILRLQQMHRDIVSVPPPGAVIIGSNEKCQCQAMIIPDRVLTVQGHPEFNKEIVEFLLENRFSRGLFGKDVFDEAFPHASDEDDGLKVAEGIMNFVSDAKA